LGRNASPAAGELHRQRGRQRTGGSQRRRGTGQPRGAILHDVVFRHNHAVGERSGDQAGNGDAIVYAGRCCSTWLEATNVTMDGNTATSDSGIAASRFAGLANVTVARNTAEGGGASLETGIPLQLSNAIVARMRGTPGADCIGPVASQGGNLASDHSCQLDNDKDRSGVDPRLAGRLRRSHASFTPVLALLAGSPAIDLGTGPGCPGRDQRGPRPIDGDRDGHAICDAGAVEYQP
jgi:hypothetical protein